MKVKDVARQFGIDSSVIEAWLPSSGHEYTRGGLGGMSIPDETVQVVVDDFKVQYAAELERLANKKAEVDAEVREKQQKLSEILITSGFNFDGYTITRYSGYISGDDIIQVDRGTAGWFSSGTNVGATLMDSLSGIRRNALAELKEAAYALGCNAVIGVDFDYLNLEPETANSSGGTTYLPYVFGVTANGNAVMIEKNNL
jgi:uncharacterized protein YbjQ (UPF0145 family)/transposase-like protein